MASIEKRVSDQGEVSFRVKVRIKGSPSQSATFERLTDARRWSEQTTSAIRDGKYFKSHEGKKHTLKEAIARYKKSALANRPKTAAAREHQLQWWIDNIGDYTLADITPALITECKEKLAQGITQYNERRTPATVNRFLQALSPVLNMAANEWEWIEASPMRKVKRLKEPRGRVRFLNEDERSRLLEACKASRNKSLYLIVILALSTGARKGELLGLSWDDVDLNRGRLTFQETKNGERRSVAVSGLALELLKEHSKVRRLDTALLFPGVDEPSLPLKIQTSWNNALTASKLDDFRFHDLRHSCASYLAMNGATLAEIAEVLGHKTLAMVKRYSHLTDSHVAGVLERMNTKILGGL